MKLFKDYNHRFGCDFVVVPIKGKSMSPYLQEGDKILASFVPCSIDKLETGELALYFDCGELTIHRLIKISKNYRAFKADRGLILEKPTEVLGKCIGVMRGKQKIFYQKNMILQKILSQLSSWHYRGKKYFFIRRSLALLIIIFSKIHSMQEIVFGGTKSIFQRS